MDGEYDRWMNDKNKYKLKVGVSVTDIGRIKFDKAEGSNDFIIDTTNWDVSNLDIKTWEEFDATMGDYMYSRLKKITHK